MRILRNLDTEKFKLFLSNYRTQLTIAAVCMALGTVYLVSRYEDNKVIMYRDLEQADYSNGKIVSPSNDIYQKKERVLSTRIEELERKIQILSEGITNQKPNLNEQPLNPAELIPTPTTEMKADPAPLITSPMMNQEPPAEYTTTQIPQGLTVPSNYGGYRAPSQVPSPMSSPSPVPNEPKISEPGPGIISFPVKGKVERTEMSVKLPSGSFVKAKLLTGVEAPEGKALPVLLQADYAFLGPNKSKIDLSGCFLIAKSTGNLSIERVEMQTSKISCVSKNGRMFERELNGFVADNKDNSFAVVGDVNSKQDRVATMAFLSSIVSGISGAISQAQTTSQTNAHGGSSVSISGDEQKYIAANGASSAASMVTQWYLKQAQSLLPTINVGSGQDVWIVIQDSIDLPNWYFKKLETRSGEFNFLSRLTD